VAKNKKIQMVSTSQPNSNLGKPKEKGLHRAVMVPPLPSQGGNNESSP
jgi:hypothetical protein